MITVKAFTFNPFMENTYLLYDETQSCVIIDPGCNDSTEEAELVSYIEKNDLKPELLLNTHTHVDHVLGNAFVAKKYNLKPQFHKVDLPYYQSVKDYASVYGINYTPGPDPEVFLDEGDKIKFGNSELDILFVPGHAPGHLAFVCHEQEFAIQGDVLFAGSIGRTDLPGGDFDTLIRSIKEKMFSLGDNYTLYTGHGPQTTVGQEKRSNPFLN